MYFALTIERTQPNDEEIELAEKVIDFFKAKGVTAGEGAFEAVDTKGKRYEHADVWKYESGCRQAKFTGMILRGWSEYFGYPYMFGDGPPSMKIYSCQLEYPIGSDENENIAQTEQYIQDIRHLKEILQAPYAKFLAKMPYTNRNMKLKPERARKIDELRKKHSKLSDDQFYKIILARSGYKLQKYTEEVKEPVMPECIYRLYGDSRRVTNIEKTRLADEYYDVTLTPVTGYIRIFFTEGGEIYNRLFTS